MNTLFSCQKKAACNSKRFELSGVEKARTRQKEGRGDKSCKRCSSPPQKKPKKAQRALERFSIESCETKTKSLQWQIRRKENTLKSSWELKIKPNNYNGQSEERKIPWRANENSKWNQPICPKPGKTLQTKSWLVLVLHLIGWESDASFSGPITEGSK